MAHMLPPFSPRWRARGGQVTQRQIGQRTPQILHGQVIQVDLGGSDLGVPKQFAHRHQVGVQP